MNTDTTPSASASRTPHDRVSYSDASRTQTRFAREVKADQLRLFCQQAIRIPIGVAFLAGYIIHLFWDLVRQDVLIGWIVVLCGAPLYRTRLSRLLLRRTLTSEEVDRWTRFMIGFALVNGALGGSAGLLFFPSAPLPEKALLTMVVAAWCAAAIATSGMMPKSFYTFAVPLMLPLTVGWWNHPEHWFNAVLLVAFLVYLVLYVRDSGRMTTDALHTRYENLVLVEELRSKQLETASARDHAESAGRSKTQFWPPRAMIFANPSPRLRCLIDYLPIRRRIPRSGVLPRTSTRR